MLYPTVADYCQQLLQTTSQILTARQQKLMELSQYLAQKNAQNKVAQLMVICTHNSRRSHLGQLWLAIAVDYFACPNIQTFSGGTMATAFHPNAVQAFRKVGLQLKAATTETDNPIYKVQWKENMTAYQAFSTTYYDATNPQKDFAAIMVCSEADEGCPVVAGADFRLSLPYEDPKISDGTAEMEQVYQARLDEIGREMLWMMQEFKNNIAQNKSETIGDLLN